ncbi:MAG: amidase [Bacteroidota bacterium]
MNQPLVLIYLHKSSHIFRPLHLFWVTLICFLTSVNVTNAQKVDSLLFQTLEAENIMGLELDQEERALMQKSLKSQKEDYEALRKVHLPNSVMPSLLFNPIPQGFSFPAATPMKLDLPSEVELPEDREELAFYSVGELAYLIKNREITSLELTRLYLNRLKKYGDTLQCVITVTEELALSQAKQADEEIAAGKYKGPLHGVPYGVKDLLSVEGYPTTWGAAPYQKQELAETATVVKRLTEAGGVLVAKLSMGALAWGDVWFGGKTKNPWNLSQGSSGSSAGSASATAAGLVGFSIGTETLGSIVSPSTRCGNSGLRPTYGRVSRHGAMALSWSMDKIGPICRSAQDCALVFEAINGPDIIDPTLYEVGFSYQEEIDWKSFKVGYVKEWFEDKHRWKKQDSLALETLRSLGADLQEVKWDIDLPVSAMNLTLSAEAAAAFDELTRSNKDSLLVRQIENAWPNVFRAARFIPAVEYIQANRIRTLLVQEVHELMKAYDVLVVPSYGGNQLTVTNLTGHPCVVVPSGFREDGTPVSISFLANLFEEGKALSLAHAFQEATDFEDRIPPLFIHSD